MYKALIRPLLFLIDPERAHYFTFGFLRIICRLPGIKSILRFLFDQRDPRLERKILGLTFRNPVGLAAGFDKDARLVDELACLGFGFIEIGTVTPMSQPGNDKPRLFRLPEDQALLNRMGFNNEGVVAAASRLSRRRSDIIVGGNLGKSKVTPNEDAESDYVIGIHALYPFVDYFVVNVSSPNTPGLRELQEKEPLRKILNRVKAVIAAKKKNKPVLLKIAPDLSDDQLDDVIEILKDTGTDGVIATNTTIGRDSLKTQPNILERIGAGGLSGMPLAGRSTEVIRYLRLQLGKDFPIIGVGGIMAPKDAAEKISAGADLVQVYTGFIYEGPGFVKKINQAILRISK